MHEEWRSRKKRPLLLILVSGVRNRGKVEGIPAEESARITGYRRGQDRERGSIKLWKVGRQVHEHEDSGAREEGEKCECTEVGVHFGMTPGL